jgi:hypothetical protein
LGTFLIPSEDPWVLTRLLLQERVFVLPAEGVAAFLRPGGEEACEIPQIWDAGAPS